MDMILKIVRIAFLCLDISALVILLLFLLSGYLAGARKKLINLISFLIPFLILLILLNPLAKVVAGITINGVTLSDMILNSIITDTSSLSQESIDLLTSIIASCFKQAIYAVGLIVCWLISLINQIILKIIFKKFIRGDLEVPNDKKSKVKKQARFVGMGISFLSFLLMFVICFFPLLGIMNLVDVTITEVQKIEETNSDVQKVSSTDEIDYEAIRQTLNKSVLYKISQITKNKETGLTLPSKYVGSIISIKSNKITANIVNEYALIIPIIPVAYKVSTDISKNNRLDLSQLSQQDLDSINRFLSKTKMLYQASPIIKDLLISSIEDEKIKQAIKEIDMNEEIRVIMDTLQIAVKGCSSLVIDFDHPETILKNEELPNSVDEIVNKLLESNLVDEVLLPFVNDKIKSSLPDDLQNLTSIFTPEKLKATLSIDVKTLLLVYQDLVEHTNFEDVITNQQKLDLSSDESIDALGRAVASLLEFQLIKDNEEVLIQFGLDSLKNDKFSYDELFNNLTPNWNTEKENIVKILEMSLKLYNDYLKENLENNQSIIEALMIKDNNNEYVFIPLLNQVASSQVFTQVLINFFNANINDFVDESVPPEVKELLHFDALRELSAEQFKIEIKRFMEIFDTLISMNMINSDEPVTITKENIEVLINNIFASVLFKNNEKVILEYFTDKAGLKEIFQDVNAELNFDDVNWNEEPQKIINVLNALLDLGSFESLDFSKILDERNDETKEKIVNLITALDESEVFGGVIFKVIETGIASTGYSVTFNDDDITKIKENGWNNEISVLFTIIDDCEKYLNEGVDYDTITGQTVSSLMITASQSVIASKIIGIKLEDILGPNNLNIMPKNSDGTNKYNLSDPQVLGETAESIGSIIDLSHSINNFDKTNDDGTTIETITTALNQIQESNITKDIVLEYLDINTMNPEDVNLIQDAETIESVYNEYAVNPDNFDITSNPELQEKVENSEIAKSVLTLLGII